MNITLPLEEMLEALTYNQLFDYVDCPNSLGDYIQRAINDAAADEHINPPCYVEVLDVGYCRVWYPIGCWTNEKKRRYDLNGALTEAQKQTAIAKAAGSSVANFNQQLIDAVKSGDKERIAALLKPKE